jgi:hypothetical protein
MDPVAITVRAVQGGWAVESALVCAPLMFLSGGRAEREAHRLAQAMARLGRDVEVAVHDKLGALIALIELRAGGPAAGERGGHGQGQGPNPRPEPGPGPGGARVLASWAPDWLTGDRPRPTKPLAPAGRELVPA